MQRLVDFHCHIDLYDDPAAAVAACERDGVDTLAVTTTPRAWPRNRELTASTRHVRAALGLHPQLVAERESELSIWEEYLGEARYVGEVGLDAGRGYRDSLDRQKRVFERMLQRCAEAGGKILSVHSVRAASPVLDLIEANLPQDRGRVVLHWFTGTTTEARRAVRLGCYFSINGAMLGTAKGRAIVAALPPERLLTETDGPFTKVDGRPSQPRDVAITVRTLRTVLSLEETKVSALIRSNLRSLVTPTAV